MTRAWAGVRESLPGTLAALVVAVAALAATPAVAQDDAGEDEPRLEWFGDARFRPETTLGVPDAPDRVRFRMRLRLGATYALPARFTVGGRLSTGNPNNPNSHYRDLGQLFDQFPLRIDRLYLGWRPTPGLEVAGGKLGHPFTINLVYGELVWDADVQPEGVMGRYSQCADDGRWSVGLTAGGFVLLEQGRREDATSLVGQGSGEVEIAGGARLRGAVGLYDYNDLTPEATAALLVRNRGNAAEDTNGDGLPDRFVSAFRLVDYMAGVRFSRLPKPLLVHVEYVRNHQSAIPEDDGWAVGVAAGELGAQGDWRSHYQYQRIGQDSVFSPFVQDDFVFATAFRGHVGGFVYRAASAFDLHVWALIAQSVHPLAPASSTHQWRLRFDATIGFPR